MRSLLVGVLSVAAILLWVGCGRKPLAAVPEKKPTRERSKFFEQVRADINSGALKGRVEAQFPTLKVDAGIAGPVAMRPSGEEPTVVRMEIPLVAQDVPPDYAELRPKLLTELESYFRELVIASGMEVDGSTREHLKEGQKDGFSFGYKSSAHHGTVSVGSEGALRGGILITLDEQE